MKPLRHSAALLAAAETGRSGKSFPARLAHVLTGGDQEDARCCEVIWTSAFVEDAARRAIKRFATAMLGRFPAPRMRRHVIAA
jgi:hypothetical protein